jgi:SAM-dependent methyltransferase
MIRPMSRATDLVQRAANAAHYYVGRAAYGPHSENGHWARIELDREIDAFLDSLDQRALSVAEVSGSHYAQRPWGSYTALEYPAFDLCAPPEQIDSYDLVICNQVLEHVIDPVRAAKTLHDICEPGGTVLVGTPFLLRVHFHPGDYWRFTEDGMRLLLEHAGLKVLSTHSWGNRGCVKANLRSPRWAFYWPWRSLRNDPLLPVVVWAYATRTASSR